MSLIWSDQPLPTFPHIQTNTNTCMSSCTHTHHTLAWSMHCAIWELCVMGSQQGDGSMCGCSLSICLSVYSHILSSTDCSSLLLLHCMIEFPSKLGIKEAVINLIHLNLKRGGFLPVFSLHVVQSQCLFDSLYHSTTNTEVPWRGKGASLSGSGKVILCDLIKLYRLKVSSTCLAPLSIFLSDVYYVY